MTTIRLSTAALAGRIRQRMKDYNVPAEILAKMTDSELIELRLMSSATRKEKQSYHGVREAAVEFIKTVKKDSKVRL